MAEKSFPPSAQRIIKARRDGRVIQSRLLSVGICLFVAAYVLQRAFSWVRDRTLLHYSSWSEAAPLSVISPAMWLGCTFILAVLVPVAVSSLAVQLLQTKGVLSLAKTLSPMQYVGPGALVRRMSESFRDVPLGVMRVGLVVTVAAPPLVHFILCGASLVGAEQGEVYRIVEETIFSIMVRVAGTVCVLGTMAYMVARRRFFRELSMSLEEVRQEAREDQGDPHLRSMRRAEAQALSLTDLERRVKRSRVVIIQRLRR